MMRMKYDVMEVDGYEYFGIRVEIFAHAWV